MNHFINLPSVHWYHEKIQIVNLPSAAILEYNREGRGGPGLDTIVAVERKSKDFVAFCLAFLLSAFGYEFLFFIMTIRVYGLTNKAMQVGIFAALTFFPKIFSP